MPPKRHEWRRHVQKINCKGGTVSYDIVADNDSLTLISKDFDHIDLEVFTQTRTQFQIGCGIDISAFNAVLTYRKSPEASAGTRGELVALEIVGPDFRFMNQEEINRSRQNITRIERVDSDPASPPPTAVNEGERRSDGDRDAMRREAMLNAIREHLQKPGEGEKQIVGYFEKMDCTSKGLFANFRIPTGHLRLLTEERSMKLMVYTPDLEGVQFGCSTKPIEFPAVIVYKAQPDTKVKTDGTVVSIEFVPKTFVLN